MNGAILPLPNAPSWHGAQLKHRHNFTFYLSVCLQGYKMEGHHESIGIFIVKFCLPGFKTIEDPTHSNKMRAKYLKTQGAFPQM
jgi:hypothetical protein